jgi:hypothetical protein
MLSFSCGVGSSDWCEYEVPDYKLPYPECCAKKCEKIRNGASPLQFKVAK